MTAVAVVPSALDTCRPAWPRSDTEAALRQAAAAALLAGPAGQGALPAAVLDRLPGLFAALRRRRTPCVPASSAPWADWLAFCDRTAGLPKLGSYHDLLDEQYRR